MSGVMLERKGDGGRTRPTAGSVAAEIVPTLRLAVPVVLAELGWMAMGVEDTLIVGRLGPEAIGAVGLGGMLHFVPAVFGMGLLLGMDTVVSRAFGEGRLDECHRSLVQGIYLALFLTPPLMLAVAALGPAMAWWGVDPPVLRLVGPYLRAINWSTPPLLIYFAFRRYVQGMGRAAPVMAALVLANVLNIAGNFVLVFGLLGFPRMGVEGSGWATCLARLAMAGMLVAYAFWHDRRARTGFWDVSLRPDRARLGRLVRLGLPAALHLTLEVGVFGAATALAGTMGAATLAAHHIVLNASSMTFMVPLGVASAGAVRVGQALGRGEPAVAARAGWSALVLGIGFMACTALAFVLLPGVVMRLYTDRPEVISIGLGLMSMAALFQIFDGMQGVATGVLRGAGDTRTPMLVNLGAHWFLGLPLGATLAFGLGWGAKGLWAGLACGLVVAGLILVRTWSAMAGRLAEEPGDPIHVPPEIRRTPHEILP
jgi:MATE family multidrug resistance protein